MLYFLLGAESARIVLVGVVNAYHLWESLAGICSINDERSWAPRIYCKSISKQKEVVSTTVTRNPIDLISVRCLFPRLLGEVGAYVPEREKMVGWNRSISRPSVATIVAEIKQSFDCEIHNCGFAIKS